MLSNIDIHIYVLIYVYFPIQIEEKYSNVLIQSPRISHKWRVIIIIIVMIIIIQMIIIAIIVTFI